MSGSSRSAVYEPLKRACIPIPTDQQLCSCITFLEIRLQEIEYAHFEQSMHILRYLKCTTKKKLEASPAQQCMSPPRKHAYWSEATTVHLHHTIPENYRELSVQMYSEYPVYPTVKFSSESRKFQFCTHTEENRLSAEARQRTGGNALL